MNRKNSTSIPRPFVKWAGGKTQLLKIIETFLPNSFLERKSLTYIEPFVGGGAVLFYLLRKCPNIKTAIINDINPHLINAYRAIKYNPQDLIKTLSDIQKKYYQLCSIEEKRDLFIELRSSFNSPSLNEIDDAAYMIFLNRTCFNGLYRENSEGKFNVSFGKYESPNICDSNLIKATSQLLQKVEIFNGDYTQIEGYANKNTFIYFDPPYRPINKGSFTSYNRVNFNDKEQYRLKEFVDELTLRGCDFLMSNSDGASDDPVNNYLDIIYSNYIIERVFARRSISCKSSNRGAISELLIRNYAPTISTSLPSDF